MVDLFFCLHVFTRRPQNAVVIRLIREHLMPASRPAGHIQRTTNTALPQRSTKTRVPTALYPTESRTFAARLAPCGALPTHD